MKIAITGHRPNKLGNDYDLKSPLLKAIRAKIITTVIEEYVHSADAEYKNGKIITFITGMALGIDTLFAKIAIEENIPFIAAIPCTGQEKMWPQKTKDLYKYLINHPLCTKYYVFQQPYNYSCMQKRNEWIVNNCDLLIAVWDGSSGGTANCVKYAAGKVKIVRINPKDILF